MAIDPLHAPIRPRPTVKIAPPARRSSGWAWLAGMAAALVVAFALFGSARRSKASAPAPVAAAIVPAPTSVARAPAAPRSLTTEQIAERALPSVVAIRCGEQSGSGFFVGEDLIVTNAHVTCAGKDIVSVLLHDGREVLGKVKSRDSWVDIATVEVVASNVPPLRVGDPLAVKPGARLAVVGSPKGLDFSVNEGTASYVGRNLHGVGYLQFSAPVNPGNSGGPLLDATGAAVGIVTLKRLDAEGIAFALPLWYARPPESTEAQKRWTAFQARLREEDAEERGKMLARLARPALLGLRPAEDGEIGALLAQMRNDVPPSGRIELQIAQGRDGCLARGMVSKWLPLDQIMKSAGHAPREAEWLLRSGDAKNLYYTVATLDLSACRLADSSAKVSLDGGEPLEISGSDLIAAAEASRKAQERHEARVSMADAANDLRAEQWRTAFRNAHARVEAASAVVSDIRSRAASEGSDPEQSPWRSRIAAAESLLRSAQSDLDALDRHASNASVPREWRR